MRLTRRKQRILRFLSAGEPSGVSLLNELRVRCIWDGEFDGAKSRQSDQRKSFNRTVLENSEHLYTYQLADNRKGLNHAFTAGLFVKWAAWELVEQGYLTSLPEPDEIVFAVGCDACSGFINLKNGQFAVVGTAVFLTDIFLVSDRECDENDLVELSKVPWRILAFKNGEIQYEPDLRVAEVDRLPYAVNISGKTWISTARKKLMFR